MKTEREIYLKPLTLREQVAMEQGICSASIYADKQIKTMGHEVGNEYSFEIGVGTDDMFGKDNNNGGTITWN